MKNEEFSPEEITLFSLAQEYSDEAKARELVEAWRWPEGAVCPHCEAKEPYNLMERKPGKEPVSKGLWKCRSCRQKFTVRVGTIFEDSHLPLSKWVMGFFLMCSSKKGMSAHQIHRMLKITYKTAWFMCHRIRHTMKALPDGLLDGDVEVDETFVGGKKRHGDPEPTGGYRKNSKKTPVVALVQRDGDVRAKVVPTVNAKNLKSFMCGNIDKGATVHTDELLVYRTLGHNFERHDTVNHGEKEYARHNTDGTCSHVNSAESFFSLLKRGVYGSWHHASKEHLEKYVDEMSFRWSNRKLTDGERMNVAIEMTEGKRLTYRQTKAA